jgi:hypothetical protein
MSARRYRRPPDQVSYPQADQSRQPTQLPAGNLTGVVDVDHGGSGTDTEFPEGSVLVAGPDGVYTVDPLFQFDLTNKRLGVGVAVPTVRLDVVQNALAAVLTPALRVANTTPATLAVPVQFSPAVIFSGQAWDTNDAVSRTVRAAFYLKPISGAATQGNVTFAADEGNGTFADHISFGVAAAGGSYDMRFGQGVVVLKNDGRGIVWTGTPLTDNLSAAVTRIVGNSDGHIDVQPGGKFLLITANTFGDTTIPAGLDIRAVDFNTFDNVIMATRFKAHPTFGTAAAGFGGRMLFQSGSTTTNYRDAAALDWIWGDATDATRSADVRIALVASAAALAEKFRFRSTGLLTFGGITSSQPAFKPSGAGLEARLADDSAYAAFRALRVTVKDDDLVAWDARSRISSPADSRLLLTNAAADNFSRLMLGGTTSAFPALVRNAAVLEVKLADDSAFAELKALALRISDGTFLVRTAAALDDGAGAGAGTLTNAPAAGDPTKWIPIDDNGTTRYIPSWTL